MWFLDPCGEEEEAQMIRNIRIAASSKEKPDAIFESFLFDLSFWDVPADDSNDKPMKQSTRKRRKNSRNSLSTTDNLRSSTRSRKNRDGSDRYSWSDPLAKTTWKSAVDPTTGRTYYYDTVSRKTQWNKVRNSPVLCVLQFILHR